MKLVGKNTLQKTVLSLSLTACLFCSMTPTASAVFDVKDAESIEKLVQILEETKKIYDEAKESKLKMAEQLNVMLKDMGIIDEATSKKLSDGLAKVNDFVSNTLWSTSSDTGIVFNSSGSVSVALPKGCFGDNSSESITVNVASDSDIQEALSNAFPTIGTKTTNEDGTETTDVGLSAKQQAWISGIGYLLRSNSHTLKVYNNLNAYLLGYQKQLDSLLELNSKIDKGTVEAQQINNQISYVRGRIESVRTALTTLDSQQAIAKSHLDAQDAMNAAIQTEAQAKQMEQTAKARKAALEYTNGK